MLPKKRTSKSKRNMRRSHDALKEKSITHCPECSEAVFPHRACPHCGYYRGRLIFNPEKD